MVRSLASGLLLVLGPPALAQDAFPLSDVLRDFEAQIREAQERSVDNDCTLAIEKATFRFVTKTATSGSAGAGGKIEILGAAVGGEAGAEQTGRQQNTIELTIAPDPGQAGAWDVSGEPPALADLIVKVKDELEVAALAESGLRLGAVKIEQSFELERAADGKITIVFLNAGGEQTSSQSHLMTLQMSSPETGGC